MKSGFLPFTGEKSGLGTFGEICKRYEITDLQDFPESCHSFAQEDTLNVAAFGRFKAGKSSFLNHFLGKQLLPIGGSPSLLL